MPQTKALLTIYEVAELLDVSAYTLRYWEKTIPMFKPNRTAGGKRKFTPDDVKMAEAIKELLYQKGLSIKAAGRVLQNTYRKYDPRRFRSCKSPKDALKLLTQVKDSIDDVHALTRVETVCNWIKTLDDKPTTDIQSVKHSKRV